MVGKAFRLGFLFGKTTNMANKSARVDENTVQLLVFWIPQDNIAHIARDRH